MASDNADRGPLSCISLGFHYDRLDLAGRVVYVSAPAASRKGNGVALEWLGSAATVTVAVAGIAGTSHAASMSRRAQIEVARLSQGQTLLAEKRTVYAEFLHAAGELVSVLKHRDRLQESLRTSQEALDFNPADGRLPAMIERLDAMGTMGSTIAYRYEG